MAPLMRLCMVTVPVAVMVLSAAYAHPKVRHFNGNGVVAPFLPVSGSCPAKFEPIRVMKENAAGAFIGDTAVTIGGWGPCSASTATRKEHASASKVKDPWKAKMRQVKDNLGVKRAAMMTDDSQRECKQCKWMKRIQKMLFNDNLVVVACIPLKERIQMPRIRPMVTISYW